MAVFQLKKKGTTKGRMQEAASRTAKEMSARSKYLGHLAAAQSYRAAAGARSAAGKTRGYARRNPITLIGIIAAIASLIGYGIYRRRG
jgi:ElaB/YqjD/DUF883 family membrane-anchored ribosome-binding protein